jgi:hypothetical protein
MPVCWPNYGVANRLLSLAEKPRLYLPVWSEEPVFLLGDTSLAMVGHW